MAAKQIRTVTLVDGAKSQKGSKSRLYAFDIYALAHATNVSPLTVARHIAAAKLNPENLPSLSNWIAHRLQHPRRSRVEPEK